MELTFLNCLYGAIFFIVSFYFLKDFRSYYRFALAKRTYPNLQRVPRVSGNIPFVGHGYKFSKDIIGFVKNCQKTYGNVFEVEIFKRKMIIVCDRGMLKEYFKSSESNFSLYEVLKDLYFGQAFSDDDKSLTDIITIVKKSVSFRSEEFIPKILDEATKFVNRMKTRDTNEPIDIGHESIKFVSCTSARCFIGIPLTDEFSEVLANFTHYLNNIVVLTYFLPEFVLKMIYNKKLSSYRKHMNRLLSPEVQTYIDDLNKRDSNILRTAVNFYMDKNCTTEQIYENVGNIIVCLLYVSSENTALGLSNSITDLILNPTFWHRLKEETAHYLKSGDLRSLFNSEFLDNCIMESARMNTHAFPLNRKSINTQVMGNYYVGDCDVIGIAVPMMMVHDCSGDIFENGTVYNPDRFGKTFINSNGTEHTQSKNSLDVLTWGSGIHLCPGKMFAIYEIKSALALLVNHFSELQIKSMGKIDYFSPSAFAERKTFVNALPYETPYYETIQSNVQYSTVTISTNNGVKSEVQVFDVDGNKGFLIRGYIDSELQQEMFKSIVAMSLGTSEHVNIETFPQEKAVPISYYNLVYTGSSNCAEPQSLFKFSSDLWSVLRSQLHENGFPNIEFVPNSMYAQLYSGVSSMGTHKDEHVDYGISISLGASCNFTFGNNTIILTSGDVFVADFSKVDHSVLNVMENTKPLWLNQEINPDIVTFGRSRMSVQIRSVEPISQIITTDQFVEMLKSQSQ